ncbi:MAG: 30S ribosomal protein S12 methylthiotransferase RimO [Kiritimatiellae bacterium]|nr:30S ribosomal protein S12 methylthiotransferase RimO [Kiritimatiellia bacterium]
MSKALPIISLVNLGCAKNTVDSERILGRLAEEGFMLASDPADSDICLVNTCGFIHAAREETAGVLRELQQLKERGALKCVVALGCLVERVHGAPELTSFLDDADASLGFQDYPRIPQILREMKTTPPPPKAAAAHGAVQILDKRFTGLAGAARSFTQNYNEFLTAPRLRIGSPHLAHLKISEGCSNLCRFCAIPYMRGTQVSRPIEDIVAESRQLIEAGARELSLIAQDTTSYGRDRYGKLALADLLRELLKVDTTAWFRLMYAFPRYLTDEVLDLMAGDPRFCRYIDMPLQHISDRVLMAMNRGMGRDDTLRLLDRVAEKLEGGAIRTTFIIGYPGETDADFEELLAFVKEGRFTHAGAFLYSHEPKTPAAKNDDNVPLAVKKERRDRLMQAQLEVSRKRLRARVGTRVSVMLDGPIPPGSARPQGTTALGRTMLEASEVDGMCFLRGREWKKIAPGTICDAVVAASLDYDIVLDPA